MAAFGIPDESCMNYEASGDGLECSPLNICRTCSPSKGCSAIEDPPLTFVEEYGTREGERLLNSHSGRCYVFFLPVFFFFARLDFQAKCMEHRT
jgi:hypothetical protein